MCTRVFRIEIVSPSNTYSLSEDTIVLVLFPSLQFSFAQFFLSFITKNSVSTVPYYFSFSFLIP